MNGDASFWQDMCKLPSICINEVTVGGASAGMGLHRNFICSSFTKNTHVFAPLDPAANHLNITSATLCDCCVISKWCFVKLNMTPDCITCPFFVRKDAFNQPVTFGQNNLKWKRTESWSAQNPSLHLLIPIFPFTTRWRQVTAATQWRMLTTQQSWCMRRVSVCSSCGIPVYVHSH